MCFPCVDIVLALARVHCIDAGAYNMDVPERTIAFLIVIHTISSNLIMTKIYPIIPGSSGPYLVQRTYDTSNSLVRSRRFKYDSETQTLGNFSFFYEPQKGLEIIIINSYLSSSSLVSLFYTSIPAISVLIPLPALTSLNAFSASSNLTVPVINFFTSTLPVETSSTASL